MTCYMFRLLEKPQSIKIYTNIINYIWAIKIILFEVAEFSPLQKWDLYKLTLDINKEIL